MDRPPDLEGDQEQPRRTGSGRRPAARILRRFRNFRSSGRRRCTPRSACMRFQHRGQEAAGIVSFDGAPFSRGAAAWPGWRPLLEGKHDQAAARAAAIGHVRYATTGETILRNVQPLFAELNSGGFAVGHNGNLTNAQTLRREPIDEGALFQSTSDTEVILISWRAAAGPSSWTASSRRCGRSRAPIRSSC